MGPRAAPRCLQGDAHRPGSRARSSRRTGRHGPLDVHGHQLRDAVGRRADRHQQSLVHDDGQLSRERDLHGRRADPCTVTIVGAGGLNSSESATYTNNVNAGTATASYEFAGDTNHTGSSDSTTFVINKANAVVAVNGYTGSLRWPGARSDGQCRRRQGRIAGRSEPGQQLHQRPRRDGALDIHRPDRQLQRQVAATRRSSSPRRSRL